MFSKMFSFYKSFEPSTKIGILYCGFAVLLNTIQTTVEAFNIVKVYKQIEKERKYKSSFEIDYYKEKYNMKYCNSKLEAIQKCLPENSLERCFTSCIWPVWIWYEFIPYSVIFLDNIAETSRKNKTEETKPEVKANETERKEEN